jgi:Domain of unknown function (DUF1772)
MGSSLKAARLANLVLLGMLTGNEFGTLAGVYPALDRISPMARLEALQGIYRRMGGFMPPYMLSTLGSFLPVLVLQRRPGTAAFRFTLAGLACFVAMVVITRRGNLPINARIEELPAEESSLEEFGELRERWTRLHAVRNVLNVAGLVFTSLGALSEPRAKYTP